MAEILHDERRTILDTRGPYFSVIRKMAAGFSIDRPLTTRTSLLSGLTMLKVMTPQGHTLVCLDAQRETDLEAVFHRGIEPSGVREYQLAVVAYPNTIQQRTAG